MPSPKVLIHLSTHCFTNLRLENLFVLEILSQYAVVDVAVTFILITSLLANVLLHFIHDLDSWGVGGGAKIKISQPEYYLFSNCSTSSVKSSIKLSLKYFFMDHLNAVCLFLAGLVGMELASNFSDKATSVTCVGRSSIPFANVLGEKIGSMLKKVKMYTSNIKIRDSLLKYKTEQIS